jgi:hypothetical protein
MATAANNPPITYEAIWSICLHLYERHHTEIEVTAVPQNITWLLTTIYPNAFIRDQLNQSYQTCIDCVIELPTDRVIAFQIWPRLECETTYLRVLFDAFIFQRQPAPITEALAALTWPIPAAIAVDSSNVHPSIRMLCNKLNIQCAQAALSSSVLHSLHTPWDKDLEQRNIDHQTFEKIFDTYLHRIHGYGPHTLEKREAFENARLTGYNQDPSWQFPALRCLLPAQGSMVADDGSVECAGVHFENELLPYWIGESVTVRRSLHNQAAAYIYVNDDVLCLGMARELRRRDGSYRTKLPQL